MVSSHARKSQIRALVQASSGGLSYSQAAKRLRALDLSDPYYCYWESYLSKEDHDLAGLAASTLTTGRDVVIFGGVGAGKSSMAHAIVAASSAERKMVLEPGIRLRSRHDGLRREGNRLLRGSDLTYDWAFAGDEVDLLALDELDGLYPYSSLPSHHAQLLRRIESAPQRIFTIHSVGGEKDCRSSLRRFCRSLPALKLRDPLFIEGRLLGREPGYREFDSAGNHNPPSRSYRTLELS